MKVFISPFTRSTYDVLRRFDVKRFSLCLFIICTGFLAACSSDSQSPRLTETETQGALDDLLADVIRLAPDPQSDSSLAALGELNIPDLSELGAVEGRLPRGMYSYDPDTSEYLLVSSSDDLIVSWPYEDPDGGEAVASMVFDWNADGATVQAAIPGTDERQEMPTGLNFKLSASGEVVADIDAKATYPNRPGCGVTVEPSSLSIGGSGSFLKLSDIGYSVTDSSVTTQGSVALEDNSLGFAWRVQANGSITREDCAPTDFALQGGEVSLTLSVQGERYALAFGVNSVDVEAGSLVLTDGALTVRSRVAVAFAGTLDDSNENGVPGENVTLTFKGQETATLEQLLQGSSMLNLALRTLRR